MDQLPQGGHYKLVNELVITVCACGATSCLCVCLCVSVCECVCPVSVCCVCVLGVCVCSVSVCCVCCMCWGPLLRMVHDVWRFLSFCGKHGHLHSVHGNSTKVLVNWILFCYNIFVTEYSCGMDGGNWDHSQLDIVPYW